jgi:hypothetical protein
LTINNTTPRNEYVGNNATTSFAYDFKILTAADLKIFLDSTEQVSGFSITQVGNDTGGQVVFTVAPGSNVNVLLERFTVTDRQTDYIEGGPLSASLLDFDQDRQTAMIQEAALRTINTSNIAGEIVWDAEGQRIINVGSPSAAADAVTKDWAETAMTSQLQIAISNANLASQHAVAASNSASASLVSENAASAFAVNASNSASAASAEASNAAISASNAASILNVLQTAPLASNLGSGEGIVAGKSSFEVTYKSLVAGSGISLGSDANEITITSLTDPALSASVAANSSAIVILQASVADHGSRINVLETSTSANLASQVDVLTSNVAVNASDIVVLNASLTAFESATASNFVITNASVAANASAITVLQGSVTANASAITVLQASTAATASTVAGFNSYFAFNPTVAGASAAVGTTASGSLAIGENANAVDNVRGQIAIGQNTRASGSHAIAIGVGTTASTFGATGAGAVAIGEQTIVGGAAGIAIGAGARTSNGTAIGFVGADTDQQTVIIGNNQLQAEGTHSIAMGTSSGTGSNIIRVRRGMLKLQGSIAQVVAPNYDTSQLPTGSVGGIVFDTSSLELKVWHSSAWQAVAPAGAGEANTASNIGVGEGLFNSKSATELKFNSIAAGSNVTIDTASSGTIRINASITTGGESNTASNLTATLGWFSSKSGVDLQFRGLVVGEGLTAASNATNITLSGSLLQASIAANASAITVLQASVGALNSNLAVTNASVAANASAITVLEGRGFVSNAVNAGGSGEGLFLNEVSGNLRFKNLVAGDGVGFSVQSSTLTISAVGAPGDVTGASNLGSGTGEPFASKSGTSLEFRSITTGTGLAISQTSTEITLDASQLASQVQAASVLADANASDIVVIQASVAANASAIAVLEGRNFASTAANAGATGEGLFINTVTGVNRFKNLVAGDNIGFSVQASTLTISSVAALAINDLNDVNITAAASDDFLFFNASASEWQNRPAVSTVDAVNAAATGEGLFITKNSNVLRFKNIVAGTNVELTSAASTLTIAASIVGGAGENNTASNRGAGEGVFVAKSSVSLEFKSLVAGTAIELSSDSSEITIAASNLSSQMAAAQSAIVVLEASAIFSGSNAAATGEGLVIGASNNVMRFKNLVAGDNIILTAGASTLTISSLNTGSAGGASVLNDLADVDITSVASNDFLFYNGGTGNWENRPTVSTVDAANAGATGEGLFINKVSDTLRFKNITGGAGIEVTSASALASTLEIDTKLTIESVGASNRTLASADFGKYLRVDSGAAQTVTVPPALFTTGNVGEQINVRQVGTGSVSFVAGSTNVTINASVLVLRGRYSTATLVCVASNELDLFGDLNNT